jgi:hypothetical protein
LRYAEDLEARAEARERREAVQAERRACWGAVQAERERIGAFRERIHAESRPIDAYFDRVGRAIDQALEAAGYRRHKRGAWRRRRGADPMAPLTNTSVPELVRLAREGERLALGELATRVPGWLHRTATEGGGYLEDAVDEALIHRIGTSEGALRKEAIAARMAIMRDDLAPPGSSPILGLLATRAAVCWLHVQNLELELDAFNGPDLNPEELRKAEAVERRLARAQARFIQALQAIARVKRLQLPVILNQVNIAKNQQINATWSG